MGKVDVHKKTFYDHNSYRSTQLKLFCKDDINVKKAARRMATCVYCPKNIATKCGAVDLTLAEDHGQQRHADVHSCFGLTEVGSARIRVEFRTDLEDARQRVHDDHAPLGQAH